MTGPPARTHEHELRSRAELGVRRRALAVLVHCFADSIGADRAILIGGRPAPASQALATWTRAGARGPAGLASEATLERALESDGPLVESDDLDGGLQLATAAPVRSGARVIGAIYAGFEPASKASRDHLLWTTDCYARLAGLCMSRDDLTLSAALGSASFDPLTGCLTYSAVVEILRAEMQRSERRGHHLSACMIDLDGFKRVNDEHGHLEGNRVLSAVGAALCGAARRYDAVGRFGGDEFMIVLPETSRGDGEQIAERFLVSLRAAVEATTQVHLDASVGITEWDGKSSPLQLLDRADEKMRRAKHAGGGRVQVHGGTGAPHDGLIEVSRQMFGPFHVDRSNHGNAGD